MNYDLCDLLNRKMENTNGHVAEFPKKSIYKFQNSIDESFEHICPEDYIQTLENENCNHECFEIFIRFRKIRFRINF